MHWLSKNMEKLSWKSHCYLGLVFLLLFWIFMLSGLILNHSKWVAPHYWATEEWEIQELAITPPAEKTGTTGADASVLAKELMEQLELVGELDNPRIRDDGKKILFNVVRPGKAILVSANLEKGLAELKTRYTSMLGTGMGLHAFTGVRANQPESARDWIWTKVWSLVIDLLAVGMILIVIGGLIISFRRAEDLPLRIAFFGLGVLTCCFFMFGLQWIY